MIIQTTLMDRLINWDKKGAESDYNLSLSINISLIKLSDSTEILYCCNTCISYIMNPLLLFTIVHSITITSLHVCMLCIH